MLHARKDYQRIQDPWEKIPEDEPVFLLRGQDVLAPDVVEYWAQLLKNQGGEEQLVTAAKAQAHKMRDWQKDQKVKVPDLPEPVVNSAMPKTNLLWMGEMGPDVIMEGFGRLPTLEAKMEVLVFLKRALEQEVMDKLGELADNRKVLANNWEKCYNEIIQLVERE